MNDERIEALEMETAQLRKLMADALQLPSATRQWLEDLTYGRPDTRALQSPPIQLQYVLIPMFSLLTGYSEKAVKRKIADGVWIQGKHYRKAPDGRITMDLQACCLWVENCRQ